MKTTSRHPKTCACDPCLIRRESLAPPELLSRRALAAAAALEKLRAEVIARDLGVCRLCGAPADAEHEEARFRPTVAYVVPWLRGGTDDLDNLQLVHAGCLE